LRSAILLSFQMKNLPSSPDLLSRARGGDAEAFGHLFEAAAGRVLLYIGLRLSPQLGARLEAEDVLQDTGLAAFQSIAEFESRVQGTFASWLCAIAENRLRERSDHHGAQKRTALGVQEAISGVLARVRQSMTGPHSAAAREEQHARLGEELAGLPEEERKALMLRYFCCHSTARIACDLGTSETSVRRLLARAALRLGSGLGDLA
jgi:RNA polymerase sigma-70 factor (ECF subfamily)